MGKYMSREQNNSFDAVNKKRRPEFDKKTEITSNRSTQFHLCNLFKYKCDHILFTPLCLISR